MANNWNPRNWRIDPGWRGWAWRIAAVAALLAFVPTSAIAQTQTAISGQVLDVNGVPYSSAKVTVLLVSSGGTPSITPCSNPQGCQLPSTQWPTTLDAAGNIQGLALWPNASIECGVTAPPCSTYTISAVFPGIPPPQGTGPQVCNVAGVTIAGVAQSLSPLLSACPAILSPYSGAPAGKVSPNRNLIYVGPNCVTGQSNCYFAYFDTTFNLSASCSNGGSTLTIPAGWVPFSPADVGKTVFGITDFLNGTVGLPKGTITAYLSATSVTVSTACNANYAGDLVLWWGHNDTAHLDAAKNAANASMAPVAVEFSTGMAMTSHGFALALSSGCATYQNDSLCGPSEIVGAYESTGLVAEPDFDFTTCTAAGSGSYTGACFGGPSLLNEISITAGGNNFSGTVLASPLLVARGPLVRSTVYGFGSGLANLAGLLMEPGATRGSGGTVFDAGAINCVAPAETGIFDLVGMTCENFESNTALKMQGGGAPVASFGSLYASGGTAIDTTLGAFYDEGGNQISGSVSGTNFYGDASVTGTAQTAARITPSTGWGTTGAAGNGVSAVSGSTRAETFTITAAGTPSANPTVAIVFPNAFFLAPSGGCSVQQIGGTGVLSDAVPGAPTAGGVSFTWEGTPVAAHTYIFRVSCSNP